MNPFDLKAALLARHAQHVVLIHFPIALFITSVAFDVIARLHMQSLAGAGGLLQPNRGGNNGAARRGQQAYLPGNCNWRAQSLGEICACIWFWVPPPLY